MKKLILLVLVLGGLNCAILPEKLQSTFEFHECLVKYLEAQNISTEFVVARSTSEIAGCKQLQSDMEVMIEQILSDVNKNLVKSLTNETEVECLMDVFRTQKFFVINIVLSAAHMTNEAGAPQLVDVFNRSKNIFLFAAMKCLVSEQMLMEIFRDFSAKLNVTDDEFICIERKLAVNDEANDTTEEIESTTTDMDSEEVTSKYPEIDGNTILRLESSAELDSDDCDETLHKVESRISHFEFPSLDNIENRCMSEKVTKNDINSVLEFIVMRKTSTTEHDIIARNEKLRSLIAGHVWNIIECTDLFGFSSIIDNLLPSPTKPLR